LGEQGTYDNVIAVFPDNKNEIILGGQLSIWKWSETNGWRVRTFSQVPLNNIYYVHADQHEIKFHPNNPDVVFVGSDGGLHRSLDRGITWQTMNKNYNITQFYGIGYSPTNEVIGGTQDNGTLYMDPDQSTTGGTQHHFVEVSGGDGGYSAISQLRPNVLFSTIYYGQLFRSEEKGAPETMYSFYSNRLFSAVSPGDPNSGNNFITPIALWEDFYDENSTVIIEDVVAPSDLEAGTQISVESQTGAGLIVKHVLTQSYNEGDTIREVVDYYQAALAVGFNGSVWVNRTPLNFYNGDWAPVADTIGNVETLEWSKDGNHLYFANTSGELYRVSNFNNAYADSLMDCEKESCVLETTRIARFSGRFITGIAVDPNNADNVVITLGGFGNNDYVFQSTEATTATATTGMGTFSSKQGDLPAMPTYTAVILWNDENKVLVGTEYGIWGTDNISSSSPSWTDENNGADYVPVYMLKQQIFENGWVAESNDDSGVRNHGYIWAGTHGRGIFRTKSFEGPVGIEPIISDNDSDMSLTLYPNPSIDYANVDFNLDKKSDVSIYVFDMNGRMVRNMKLDNLSAGAHKQTISVSDLRNGVYVVKLVAGSNEQVSRIVVE
jgi:hypothetical protein